MLFVRRIVGDSMLPVLRPGKIVIALKLPLQQGDVVIAKHKDREVIKRITELTDEGVFLLGDNPAASTDSRSYGMLSRDEIIATVVWPLRLHRKI